MGETRRRVLRDAALLTAGAAAGAVGFAEAATVAERKLPIRGGAASATVASRRIHPGRGQILVTWAVETSRPLVALTFDDGPRPDWTDLTLDTLAEHRVPATFFMVGRRVRKYASVLDGRFGAGGHEAANHSWDHLDLARRDPTQAYDDLIRAHDAIGEVTGRTPALLRPPYGHMGGSAALAAARLDYRVVLWSQQMLESDYPGDPSGHAKMIVDAVVPGTILLGHDVGASDRLVALRGLPEMIAGLRARGYIFVTVSDLLAEAPLAAV